MCPYKVGTQLRCIREDYPFKTGDIVTVTRIIPSNPELCYATRDTDNRSDAIYFDRFEPLVPSDNTALDYLKAKLLQLDRDGRASSTEGSTLSAMLRTVYGLKLETKTEFVPA